MTANSAALWDAILAGLCLVLVGSGFRSVRHTTLTGPWVWSLCALAAVFVVELVLAFSALQPAEMVRMRYVAGVTTLCPAMSVLGAKRPQNRAWHFIVCSFWIVLILPAAESFFVRRGAMLHVPTLLGLLLWAVIITELGNYVPTRFWLSALCIAAGQILMLAGQLPAARVLAFDARFPVAAGLWLFAVLQVCCRWPRAAAPSRALDRVWLDFRDMFGAAWALRVAERLNLASQRHAWAGYLSWHGFVVRTAADVTADAECIVNPTMERSFRMLLRRFVSAAWLDQRMK